MPRLMYVVNIPRFFVSHRLPLALAAQQAGYEVHVATSDADAEHVAQIRAAGLPFHPLPLSQHGTSPLTEWTTLRALIRLYRQLKPDIVHQVSIKPVIYGGLAARFAGVPAVVSAMSGLGYVFISDERKSRILRLLVQPAFKLALAGKNTRMIFQNPDDRQRFAQLGLIPQERSTLIRGSGVDLARFVPVPEAEGTPIVLFAGRLMWQKGVGDFVGAARRLRGKARFVIVGYPEPTSPSAVSSEQLTTWQQEGIIEYWGKRDDMPNVIAQSHIVCLPSTYGEGVPKVLIEAAACARPIVTTDTSGCREITQHEVNGLLFPPNDVDSLVKALTRLLDDKSLRQHMGEQGRLLAQEFAFERVAQATFALYTALLSEHVQK